MPDFDAQLVRLYDTVFDRAPDPEGRVFWNNSLDQGYSFTVLAEHFMRAPEFAASYGQPTNRQFVESLYENILDRPGEAAGVQFWTDALDSGRAQRAETVVAFSESPEHIVHMAQPPTGSSISGTGVLNGGAGADTVQGGAGDDTLSGFGGDDILEGNGGQDVLVGGAGNDTFVFRPGDGHDTINDFQRGDHLRFVGVGAADVHIVAAHGQPGPNDGMSGFGGYDVVYGTGTQQGTFHLNGIANADLPWVQDSFIFV